MIVTPTNVAFVFPSLISTAALSTARAQFPTTEPPCQSNFAPDVTKTAAALSAVLLSNNTSSKDPCAPLINTTPPPSLPLLFLNSTVFNTIVAPFLATNPPPEHNARDGTFASAMDENTVSNLEP